MVNVDRSGDQGQKLRWRIMWKPWVEPDLERNSLGLAGCQPVLILDHGLVISSSQPLPALLFLKHAGQGHSAHVKMGAVDTASHSPVRRMGTAPLTV